MCFSSPYPVLITLSAVIPTRRILSVWKKDIYRGPFQLTGRKCVLCGSSCRSSEKARLS